MIGVTLLAGSAAAFFEADRGVEYRAVGNGPTTVKAGIPWCEGGARSAPAEWTVNGRASFVYILHTFDPNEKLNVFDRQAAGRLMEKDREPLTPPALFHYTLHYADGTSFRVPVRWMDGIGARRRLDWEKYTGILSDLPWARIAERKCVDPTPGKYEVVYAFKIVNPQPEHTIDRISADASEWGTASIDALTLGVRSEKRLWAATDGSDRNSGTFDAPFRSVQHALDCAQPGDTVYLRGGSYVLKEIITFPRSGKEDAWITLSGLPGEPAVIDGQQVYDLGVRTGLLHAAGRDWIKVNGLFVQYSECQGITFKDDCSHIKIFGNRVFRTCESGIGVWRDQLEGSRFIQAYGNRIHMACSTDTYLKFGKPFRNEKRRRAGEECLDAGGIVDFDYAWNIVSFGDKESIDCKGPVRRGRIRYNYAFNCGSIYIDAWNEDIEDIDVHHNVSHDSWIGFKVSTEGVSSAHRVRFHHNLAFDSKSHGFCVTRYGEQKGGWKNDIQAYSNTLLNNGGHGIAIEGKKVRDGRIVNNIVFGSKSANLAAADFDYAELNLVLRDNLVDRRPDDAPVDKGMVSRPDGGRYAERLPIFLSATGFHPDPASPLWKEWSAIPGAFSPGTEWLPPLD